MTEKTDIHGELGQYIFDEYQRLARRTAVYPNLGHNLWYPALGLNGEAGEVAEKVKKIYRDHNGVINSIETVNDIANELGDVLWYIANIASELEISLGSVAINNISKLQSRAERDKIHGSGDTR